MSVINKKEILSIADDTVGRANIAVIGVGGCGGNIVNKIAKSSMPVDTISINTDSQAIERSFSDVTIVVGKNITNGLGAGANPEVGLRAVNEDMDKIKDELKDVDLAFVVAGLGGGTGTLGASAVAAAAREMGIITVAVVTRPFFFEGNKRDVQAKRGIAEIREVCDTLICINNQMLVNKFKGKKSPLSDVFGEVDEILFGAVQAVVEVVNKNSYINIDFADIKSIMAAGGMALIGIGEGRGKERASDAVKKALTSDLISLGSLSSAKAAIISIVGPNDVSFDEIQDISDEVYKRLGDGSNIIFGANTSNQDETLKVIIIASGVNEGMNNETSDGNSYIDSIAPIKPIEV